MLDYSIMKPEGILLLSPHGSLTKEDFDRVSTAVDAYLSEHAELQGVLIHAKEFPGWESFSAFNAHMHFGHDHHKRIKRVALATDSHFAAIAESLGQYFTSAILKHFEYSDDAAALEWLKAT